MKCLEFLLILILVIYIGLMIRKKFHKEGFNSNMNHYKVAYIYDEIYDDFYCFLYDDLFYNEVYYKILCNHLLNYINHVYNNHLSIGIKHGGHLNQLLKKNMKTTSVSRSKACIRMCKYNYKDNIYKHKHNVLENPFSFDEHEFTHISLIDNELYYIENLEAFFYNISKWIILKGYVIIPFYHSKESLKKGFFKYPENSHFRLHKDYSYTFNDTGTNENMETITCVEVLKDKQHQRKNIHTLFFYQKEYIQSLAKSYQLIHIDTIGCTPHESVFIFQKL